MGFMKSSFLVNRKLLQMQLTRQTSSLSPTYEILLQAAAYLKWNIPGHVNVTLVVVHPHLSRSQGVASHVGRQILRVWFVSTLNVGDPGARQDFHAASALPHLL